MLNTTFEEPVLFSLSPVTDATVVHLVDPSEMDGVDIDTELRGANSLFMEGPKMETHQILLRERCNSSGTVTRRHRFLLGATATHELGIPLLARTVRLAVVCGLLVALTARPTSACPVAELTVDPTYTGPGCCWDFGLYQYAGAPMNIVTIEADIITPGFTVASAAVGNLPLGTVTTNPTNIRWSGFDLWSNCSKPYQGIPTYTVHACFSSTVDSSIPFTVVFTQNGVSLMLSDAACVRPCTTPPPDMVAWYTGDDGPNDFLGNHHAIPVGITESWARRVGSGTLALPYLFPRM